MADAIAGQSSQRLGRIDLPTVPHSLVLENIMDEIVPLRQWHFRTANLHQTPVLSDILGHQHSTMLTNMTTYRDSWNDEHRWSSTALSFASAIHPPQDSSFWAAARRSLIIYDWGGHGRNRAKQCKLHPAQRTRTEQCGHCFQKDSQAHCMLECPHLPFAAIRKSAKIKQCGIAADLLRTFAADEDLKHFVQQMCHASWAPSPHISRIWLGTWSMHTLHELLGQPMDTPMTMQQRYTYINTAKQLTAPLITAYHALIHINIKHTSTIPSHDIDPLPLYDHLPLDTHTEVPDTDPSHPDYNNPLPTRIREIENTFIQQHSCEPGPSLHEARTAIADHPFSISDAAFLNSNADDIF